jgi:nucleotide-binding universal stress UspA family protein
VKVKILVAVDGSTSSDAAVDRVASISWPAKSEVKVLSVIEPIINSMTEAWALPDSYYERVVKAEEDRATAALGRAADRLSHCPSPELAVSRDLARGFSKEVILDEAERWGADLIVLGSHGYRGLTRFLLGSVSRAVADHAKCSVMIIRPNPSEIPH